MLPPRKAYDSLLGSSGWSIKSAYLPESLGVSWGESPIFIDCNSHCKCRSQQLPRDSAAPTHLDWVYLRQEGLSRTHSSWLSEDMAVLSFTNVLTPVSMAFAHSEHQSIPTAAETSRTYHERYEDEKAFLIISASDFPHIHWGLYVESWSRG